MCIFQELIRTINPKDCTKHVLWQWSVCYTSVMGEKPNLTSADLPTTGRDHIITGKPHHCRYKSHYHQLKCGQQSYHVGRNLIPTERRVITVGRNLILIISSLDMPLQPVHPVVVFIIFQYTTKQLCLRCSWAWNYKRCTVLGIQVIYKQLHLRLSA